MKTVSICLLLLISVVGLSQTISVEMLPAAINKAGTVNTNPSFNESQTRLCFYRIAKKQKAIMISDRSPSGEWSEPYQALGDLKDVYGVTINSAGTRIYFGLNGDLYFGEFVGEHHWSGPLKIDALSTDANEDRPSVTSDEQNIAFMRSTRISEKSSWTALPFISSKHHTSICTNTKPISIRDASGPIEEFLVSQDNSLILYSVASSTAYHNFYATSVDSAYSDSKQIDFSGGKIRWISKDLSTGLAETFTQPRKIVKINFPKGTFTNAPAPQLVASVPEIAAAPEAASAVKPGGKYFALLIGVSTYADPYLNLDRPVKDSYAFGDLLVKNYQFDQENVKVLANPTRQEIISELFRLRSVIGRDDNLLIFFAGHGYWDKPVSQGYWWPKDAKQNDPSYWLSNSDLREQIRGIKSGHTLLISDACFSGGIFKSRGLNDIHLAPTNIQLLYKTKSRRAITSGNMSSVPDQSVFFEYLSSRLVENTEKFLPSQTLFNSLKIAVINNSMNIPQEGVISDSGDEGGDFIFIRRN